MASIDWSLSVVPCTSQGWSSTCYFVPRSMLGKTAGRHVIDSKIYPKALSPNFPVPTRRSILRCRFLAMTAICPGHLVVVPMQLIVQRPSGEPSECQLQGRFHLLPSSPHTYHSFFIVVKVMIFPMLDYGWRFRRRGFGGRLRG